VVVPYANPARIRIATRVLLFRGGLRGSGSGSNEDMLLIARAIEKNASDAIQARSRHEGALAAACTTRVSVDLVGTRGRYSPATRRTTRVDTASFAGGSARRRRVAFVGLATV